MGSGSACPCTAAARCPTGCSPSPLHEGHTVHAAHLLRVGFGVLPLLSKGKGAEFCYGACDAETQAGRRALHHDAPEKPVSPRWIGGGGVHHYSAAAGRHTPHLFTPGQGGARRKGCTMGMPQPMPSAARRGGVVAC